MTDMAAAAAILAGKVSILGGALVGAAVGGLGWLWKNRKGRK